MADYKGLEPNCEWKTNNSQLRDRCVYGSRDRICGGTHKPRDGDDPSPIMFATVMAQGWYDANARMRLGLKDFVTGNNLAHSLFTLVR